MNAGVDGIKASACGSFAWIWLRVINFGGCEWNRAMPDLGLDRVNGGEH